MILAGKKGIMVKLGFGGTDSVIAAKNEGEVGNGSRYLTMSGF